MSKKFKREVKDKLSFISYKLDLLLQLMGTHMGKEFTEIVKDNIEQYKKIKETENE